MLFTLTFKWYNVVSALLGLHPHRVGAYARLNFGFIAVDWSRQRVQATIHGEGGEVGLAREWSFGALDQAYSAECARSQHTVCGHPPRPKWYMNVGLVLVLVPHALAVLLLVKGVCKVTKLVLKMVKGLLSLCRGGSTARQIAKKKEKNI